jgi:hypothetical protein
VLPLAIYGAGLALQTIGQLQADSAQANAERQNASYFREQEQFSLEEMFRETGIFDRKAAATKGQQLTHAGGSGTTITSFTLDRLGEQSALMAAQKQAIIRQGEYKARLAGLRASQADQTADALDSPERKLMTIGGGVLSAAMAFA